MKTAKSRSRKPRQTDYHLPQALKVWRFAAALGNIRELIVPAKNSVRLSFVETKQIFDNETHLMLVLNRFVQAGGCGAVSCGLAVRGKGCCERSRREV